ncbi:hypothetical protein R70723_05500 [Paenibacillus sp. FSL R7-0273]|uniref:hypothetical protein n=1 Tax=Paenibacillus sp. FSL R7-0273 TaxID=1536772 RepID=UPI0004F8C268|nr:hypothetical protein [Paenibacillus sp. FSL R7-0273]AIQ45413.1 hypothetical protein R70723_05500 [Paenibacillus sp. FSL R7-0273]OMF89958.1 hypothetical protein BK144_18385 [Paenibacillus sp. FSL R7-0273]
MKKILSLLIVLMVVVVPLSYIPAAAAEAVNPADGTERQLERQTPINFPVATYGYKYLGTANGLLYFKEPLLSKNPRNAKGQMLQEYVVTINSKTNKVEWELPIYGGFKFGDRAFFDKAGNLYSLVGAGLKQFSDETFLYCISPKGTLKWEVIFPRSLEIDGLINNQLFVHDNSSVYAVNLNGTVAWSKSFERPKMQPSHFLSGVALNEILTLKYNSQHIESSFDVLDWNLKKKLSYPLSASSRVEQALKLNNDTYILKIKKSKSTTLLVAIGTDGKAKWTKGIDPTTNILYIVDGKLLYANNKGFYVLNGSGEQLNHTPLSPIGVTGIFYRLRLDDKYISITVDGRIETQTALTVLDRKSYKTLYSLPYPLKVGEESKIYFDDILFTQNSFYTVYDDQLIPIK